MRLPSAIARRAAELFKAHATLSHFTIASLMHACEYDARHDRSAAYYFSALRGARGCAAAGADALAALPSAPGSQRRPKRAVATTPLRRQYDIADDGKHYDCARQRARRCQAALRPGIRRCDDGERAAADSFAEDFPRRLAIVSPSSCFIRSASLLFVLGMIALLPGELTLIKREGLKMMIGRYCFIRHFSLGLTRHLLSRPQFYVTTPAP